MQKKKWKKPELVVIVKCKPEESVLAVCKASRFSCGHPTDGPTSIIAAS